MSSKAVSSTHKKGRSQNHNPASSDLDMMDIDANPAMKKEKGKVLVPDSDDEISQSPPAQSPWFYLL